MLQWTHTHTNLCSICIIAFYKKKENLFHCNFSDFSWISISYFRLIFLTQHSQVFAAEAKIDIASWLKCNKIGNDRHISITKQKNLLENFAKNWWRKKISRKKFDVKIFLISSILYDLTATTKILRLVNHLKQTFIIELNR